MAPVEVWGGEAPCPRGHDDPQSFLGPAGQDGGLEGAGKASLRGTGQHDHDPLHLRSPSGQGREDGGGVSRRESCQGDPPPWTPQDLKDAEWFRLGMVPATPQAEGLVEDLTQMCRDQEAPYRGNRRGKTGMAKLRRAVGAIVGNTLTQWLRSSPRAVFQSQMVAAFTGEMVGHLQFMAAQKALLALGMIDTAEGVSYPRRNGTAGSFQRHAGRLRPTQALVDMAMSHGIGQETIKAAFRMEYPKAPVVVTYSKAVEVREVLPIAAKRAGLKAQGRPDVEALPHFREVRLEVLEVNADAARHTFDGCRPPSWSRVFAQDIEFQGRWYARGSSYQIMSKGERAAIRIDGEPVVELDIRASFLTIMAALAGTTLPPGDPYHVDGIPRPVVKHWVHVSLGNGRACAAWSRETIKNHPTVEGWPADEVGGALTAHLPFLTDLTAPTILTAAGMDRFIGLRDAPRMLNHRLAGIEAEAMTLAMRTLRARGVVALPVHDSLILPRSAAVVARDAIQQACKATYGAVPVVTGLPE